MLGAHPQYVVVLDRLAVASRTGVRVDLLRLDLDAHQPTDGDPLPRGRAADIPRPISTEANQRPISTEANQRPISTEANQRPVST
jgi:hypothetical protein